MKSTYWVAMAAFLGSLLSGFHPLAGDNHARLWAQPGGRPAQRHRAGHSSPAPSAPSVSSRPSAPIRPSAPNAPIAPSGGGGGGGASVGGGMQHRVRGGSAPVGSAPGGSAPAISNPGFRSNLQPGVTPNAPVGSPPGASSGPTFNGNSGIHRGRPHTGFQGGNAGGGAAGTASPQPSIGANQTVIGNSATAVTGQVYSNAPNQNAPSQNAPSQNTPSQNTPSQIKTPTPPGIPQPNHRLTNGSPPAEAPRGGHRRLQPNFTPHSNQGTANQGSTPNPTANVEPHRRHSATGNPPGKSFSTPSPSAVVGGPGFSDQSANPRLNQPTLSGLGRGSGTQPELTHRMGTHPGSTSPGSINHLHRHLNRHGTGNHVPSGNPVGNGNNIANGNTFGHSNQTRVASPYPSQGFRNGTGFSGAQPFVWGMTQGGYGVLPYGSGYLSYSNPYVSNLNQTNIPSQGFNYSQPIPMASRRSSTPAAQPGSILQGESQQQLLLNSAVNSFKQNQFADALEISDLLIAQYPADPVVHEFHALALFALGDYQQAAATLHAVLAVSPGWDWETLISIYSDIRIYTTHLRALEAVSKQNQDDSATRFLLAYHYLAGGSPDAAARMLTRVVAMVPRDQVAIDLLQMIAPPEKTNPSEFAAPTIAASTAQPTPEPPTVDTPPLQPSPSTPPININPTVFQGSWKATREEGSAFLLTFDNEKTFTWSFTPKDQPTQSFSGLYSVEGNTLTLERTGGGSLVARLVSTSDAGFQFKLVGSPATDPGLEFAR